MRGRFTFIWFSEIYKDDKEVRRIYVNDYTASEFDAKDWCFKD